MNIATITFHRALNFGSALQSYALQHFVTQLGEQCHTPIHYRIIDLAPAIQKEIYAPYKLSLQPKNLAKNLINLINVQALTIRRLKFETFLREELQLTAPFTSGAEARAALQDVDCFISGSDQLWNVRARDFADFYYLDFVQGARKISYAASFGPLRIDWQQYNAAHYAALLHDYSAISVREQGSADNVEQLTGMRPEIHVDPTLLLDVAEWRQLQSDANYQGGNYILLYCLEPSVAQLNMARALSRRTGLPIVTLRYNNKHDMLNPFVKRYDAGPRDFLAYIDHAAMVVTSSFHGTAFSLIYRKPFVALDGMADARICNMLTEAGLCHHALASKAAVESAHLAAPSESAIGTYLARERERSAAYLKQALAL